MPDSERIVPPDWMAEKAGAGPFDQVGEEFVGYLTDFCELDPDDTVLDAGCGAGRVAIPLTRLLSANGRYEGFDVLPWVTDWCAEEITSRHPNFRFRHADVCSGQYYPNGQVRPANYTFPYESDRFDVVCATSLFTHMLQDGVEQYVAEMARVVKTGGRLLLTFYLLNDESLRSLEAGHVPEELGFRHRLRACRVTYEDEPEYAVAHDEPHVLRVLEQSGLVVNGIHYGQWARHAGYLSWQDILVAELPG